MVCRGPDDASGDGQRATPCSAPDRDGAADAASTRIDLDETPRVRLVDPNGVRSHGDRPKKGRESPRTDDRAGQRVDVTESATAGHPNPGGADSDLGRRISVNLCDPELALPYVYAPDPPRRVTNDRIVIDVDGCRDPELLPACGERATAERTRIGAVHVDALEQAALVRI